MMPFLLLAAGMIAALVAVRAAGIVLFGLALVVGLYLGVLPVTGLVITLVFCGLLYGFGAVPHQWAKAGFIVAAVLVGLTLGIHAIPGFTRLELATVHFGQSPASYTIGTSLDKWLVGAATLLFLRQLRAEVSALAPARLAVCVGLPPALIVLGVALGVPVDVKAGNAVALFLGVNLITCIVEEAFYRLLIQERLYSIMPAIPALILISAFFLATHYSSSVSGLALALFGAGGLLYALAYHLTRSLPVAIGVHFGTNALHVLLLQYPLT